MTSDGRLVPPTRLYFAHATRATLLPLCANHRFAGSENEGIQVTGMEQGLGSVIVPGWPSTRFNSTLVFNLAVTWSRLVGDVRLAMWWWWSPDWGVDAGKQTPYPLERKKMLFITNSLKSLRKILWHDSHNRKCSYTRFATMLHKLYIIQRLLWVMCWEGYRTILNYWLLLRGDIAQSVPCTATIFWSSYYASPS
jgi:hypothetical protein